MGCALGRNRTCDLRFRKPTLYPLSYEGMASNGRASTDATSSRKRGEARWRPVAGGGDA